MSKLPLVSLFSAAHVSKWDALSEAGHVYASQSGYERGRAMWPINGDDLPNDNVRSESPKSDKIVQREPIVGAAASVGGDPVSPRARRVAVGSREDMAIKTHTWITLWFLLTAPVILWDAMYCFMRPRSMVGGDLHWIWEPYGLYQEIDYVYGVKALEENNGFTSAQSFLNLIETALNLAYVYLAHISNWSGAPLIGFAAVTMTLSKTVLYWAQEYYCGGCAVGHNTWSNLLLYWALPNGMWIVFPSLIVWRLGGDIIDSLSAASRGADKTASGKAQ